MPLPVRSSPAISPAPIIPASQTSSRKTAMPSTFQFTGRASSRAGGPPLISKEITINGFDTVEKGDIHAIAQALSTPDADRRMKYYKPAEKDNDQTLVFETWSSEANKNQPPDWTVELLYTPEDVAKRCRIKNAATSGVEHEATASNLQPREDVAESSAQSPMQHGSRQSPVELKLREERSGLKAEIRISTDPAKYEATTSGSEVTKDVKAWVDKVNEDGITTLRLHYVGDKFVFQMRLPISSEASAVAASRKTTIAETDPEVIWREQESFHKSVGALAGGIKPACTVDSKLFELAEKRNARLKPGYIRRDLGNVPANLVAILDEKHVLQTLEAHADLFGIGSTYQSAAKALQAICENKQPWPVFDHLYTQPEQERTGRLLGFEEHARIYETWQKDKLKNNGDIPQEKYGALESQTRLCSHEADVAKEHGIGGDIFAIWDTPGSEALVDRKIEQNRALNKELREVHARRLEEDPKANWKTTKADFVFNLIFEPKPSAST